MQDSPITTKEIKEQPFGYGVKRAAVLMGLSERTVRKAIEDGSLRYCRIGKRILLRPCDIEAFFAEHVV